MATSPAEAVLAGLRARADAARRAHSQGYFPTSLSILGVPAPAMRAVLRPLARALRDEAPEAVLSVAHELVDTGVHEARQLAYELIGGRKDVVSGLDGPVVESLGRGNDNWASVDGFGVFVGGPAWRDGRVTDGDVLRWAGSDDRWWRRTALVCTVPLNQRSRGGKGDVPRTLAVCDALATDGDAMVAKALSWALRALSTVDADAVRAFLSRWGDDVPALVRREVRNKLETGRKSGRRSS